MSQLPNMIVLAARQRELPFCRQIVLSMHKNILMKNSQGTKVNEYSYQPENVKKRHTHFISLPSIVFSFRFKFLKAGEPLVQSRVLIHSSLSLLAFPLLRLSQK